MLVSCQSQGDENVYLTLENSHIYQIMSQH